jgi:hypothetical protein
MLTMGLRGTATNKVQRTPNRGVPSGRGGGPSGGPTAQKSTHLRESRQVERTHLLRLKLSTRHHVANRGRVPLPAARRIDPARVQSLGDLPQ